MTPETKKQLKAALLTYVRAAIAAVGAVFLASLQDPNFFNGISIGSALLAAVLAPAIKALDPNADEYGIGAKVAEALKHSKKDTGI